jgi:hypothetical protein
MSDGSKTVRIRVKGLKVNTLIAPASLPADMVGAEGQPAGSPVILLEIEGSPLVIRAAMNGKSMRRALKVIADLGAENVIAVLQGNLGAPTKPGGPYELQSAGLAVTPKTPKPADTAPQAPKGAN